MGLVMDWNPAPPPRDREPNRLLRGIFIGLLISLPLDALLAYGVWLLARM